MKSMFLGAAALAATLTFSPAHTMALSNPGFETGNYASWSTTGNAYVTGSYGGILTPSQGNYQAHLLNADKNIFSLASFLNVSWSNLYDLVGWYGSGSAIKQTFSVSEESTLSFDWRFAIQKYNNKDQVGIMVLNGDIHVLADTDSADFDSYFTLYGSKYKITSWDTFDTILTTGTHTLGFAVLGEKHSTTAKLLVDNVRIEAVPEPVTAGLTMMGLGALGLSLRRRRGIEA